MVCRKANSTTSLSWWYFLLARLRRVLERNFETEGRYNIAHLQRWEFRHALNPNTWDIKLGIRILLVTQSTLLLHTNRSNVANYSRTRSVFVYLLGPFPNLLHRTSQIR